jgi:tetratricopeptide (TPR) repeat protein
LAAFREKTATQREAPKPSFDPTAQEKLGALGYVASSEGVSGPDSPGKETDPKDGIEIVNAIHRAELLHQSMQTDAAIAILKQVIAKEPSFNPYMAKLGDWLREKGDFQEALLYLRKARDMKPESVEDRFLLSKALMAARDFKAAIPELEFVVAKVPNMLDAHSYLQLAYLQADQLSDAIRECHTVLGYVGEDYGSYLILGKASALSGDTQAGVTALKKAASLEPRDPTPHLWLAEVYDQSGQKTEAAAERATARRLGAVPR